jgi:hypothetical protein
VARHILRVKPRHLEGVQPPFSRRCWTTPKTVRTHGTAPHLVVWLS